jgi:hypothetical protein
VLGLCEFYKLLPDIDLKECYFEGAWGFQKDEFVLANWREMSGVEMRREAEGRQARGVSPEIDGRVVYAGDEVDVGTRGSNQEVLPGGRGFRPSRHGVPPPPPLVHVRNGRGPLAAYVSRRREPGQAVG